MNEFAINWIKGADYAEITVPSGTALKSKLLKLAEEKPDEAVEKAAEQEEGTEEETTEAATEATTEAQSMKNEHTPREKTLGVISFYGYLVNC